MDGKHSSYYTRTLSWLNFGSFPGSVLFANGYQYDELIATLKRKRQRSWIVALENSEALAREAQNLTLFQEIEEKGGTYQYFFLLIQRPFEFTDEEYCILAHECLHLCQFHLSKVLNRDREFEAEAYTHTHLMKQAIAAMRTQPKNKPEGILEGETGVLKIR